MRAGIVCIRIRSSQNKWSSDKEAVKFSALSSLHFLTTAKWMRVKAPSVWEQSASRRWTTAARHRDLICKKHWSLSALWSRVSLQHCSQQCLQSLQPGITMGLAHHEPLCELLSHQFVKSDLIWEKDRVVICTPVLSLSANIIVNSWAGELQERHSPGSATNDPASTSKNLGTVNCA